VSANSSEENIDSADAQNVQAEAILSDTKEKSEIDAFTSEIHDLRRELDQERQRSSDLVNRMRYLQADVANLQRQSDRRVNEVRNQVKLTWLLEIITIKEDLDRAISAARESDKKSGLVDGLILVASRIENILKLEDVDVIPAHLGGKFDPNRHEALSYKESETKENGTILAVISPGYLVEGKVIKPSMVEVARRKEKKNGGHNKTDNSVTKENEIKEDAGKQDQ